MYRRRSWGCVFTLLFTLLFTTGSCAEVSAETDANWRIAFPRVQPRILRTDHFLIMGPSPDELQEVADLAEAMRERVLKLLKLPSADSSLKMGGARTIYVLPKRYDYGEFGRMVENRQLPLEMHGHWRNTEEFAYIVLGPPAEGGLPLETLLAQYLASTLVDSWGDVPTWYADGVGYVVAERLNRRHPQIRRWRASAAQVVPALKSVTPLLAHDLPLESAGVVHWAFARFLMRDNQRGHLLLRALQEGRPFEESFVAAYGAPPETVCRVWLRRSGGGKQKK